MKRFLAVLLTVALVLSLVACGNKDGLVKVGDTVITSNDLDQYVELYAYVQGMDLTQITEEKSLKYIKSLMLEDLITMEAIKQYYDGKEDKVLPKTYDADLKKFIKESKDNENVGTFIKEKKISDKALTNFYMNQLYIKAFYEEIEAGMPNLEKDAKAYYEKNKTEFAVDEVTASHILVKDETTAKQVLAKIKAGEKFEDLAKQYSIDTTTKDKGGKLGTFGRGQMVKEFEDAAFALKPGEVSDVVKTKYGYHIIKVTDKNQGTKSYDEAKNTIISNLVSPTAEKKIAEIRKAAGVKYLTDEYGQDSAKQGTTSQGSIN